MKKLFFISLFSVILALTACDVTTTSVTIQFDTQGGNIISDMVVDATVATLNLPTPVKTGYEFGGWFIDQSYNTPFSTDSLQLNTTLILFARWLIGTTDATLTFETDGGSLIQPVTQSSGSTITEPTTDKTDHFFMGWYRDLLHTTPFTFDVMPQASLTIYAKWISYTEIGDLVNAVTIDDNYTLQINYKVMSYDLQRDKYIIAKRDHDLLYYQQLENTIQNSSDYSMLSEVYVSGAQGSRNRYLAYADGTSLLAPEIDCWNHRVISDMEFDMQVEFQEDYLNMPSFYFPDGIDFDWFEYSNGFITLMPNHYDDYAALLSNFDTPDIILVQIELAANQVIMRVQTETDNNNTQDVEIIYSNIGSTSIVLPTIEACPIWVAFDFTYDTIGNEVTITGYVGTPFEHLEIPTTIDGKNVTKIADSAFKEAENIQKIILPHTITHIGLDAFKDCLDLDEVTIHAISPPVIGNDAFTNTDSGLQIRVTNQSVNQYKIDWLAYESKIIPIPYYTVTFEVNGGTLISGDLIQVIDQGNGATAPVLERYGYTLSWDNSFSYIYNNKIITAIWTPIIYEITFDENGGTIINSGIKFQVVPYGDVPIDPVAYREDYYFEGWYKDIDGLVPFEFEPLIEHIDTIYATWRLIPIEERGLEFTTNSDETLTVSYYSGNSPIIIIPSKAYGKDVVGIDYNVFSQNSQITSVTIPSSIIHIHDRAFENMSQLQVVQFEPNSKLELIGLNAFRSNTKLTTITIPSSVKEIGNGAFEFCIELASVTIEPNSQLTKIGNSAFAINTKLTNFSLPSSVIEIGSYAFHRTSNLTTFTIEANTNLQIIGRSAFSQSIKLVQFMIPATVTQLGGSVFDGCTELASVTFENGTSLTSIPENLFEKCEGLVTITIPESITIIGPNAFLDCINLETINIPVGLTEIGGNAFANCQKLQSIHLPLSITTLGTQVFYMCANLIISTDYTAKPDGWNFNWNPNNYPVTWEPLYHAVTFSANGGTYISGNEVQSVLDGTAAIPPVYEKEGYYLSWSTSVNHITSDLSISAVWIPRRHTVRFEGNGGTFVSGTTTQYILHTEAATPPEYTRVGHDLSGWDADYTQITSNITINAIWTPHEYTVTFSGNGATLLSGDEVQSVAHGSSAIPPIYDMEAYNATWSSSIHNITGPKTITASWSIKTFSVVFYTDSATVESGSTNQIIEYGSSAIAPVLTLGGYDFVGWDKSFDNVTSNLGIIALWTPKLYTVTFDGRDGTLVSGDEVQLVPYQQSAVAPVYELTDFEIEGWNLAFGSVTQDITITANWRSTVFEHEWRTGGYWILGLLPGVTNEILNLPATINQHGVIGIKFQAFQNKTFIKEVTIPQSITTIERSIFLDCTAIERIKVPLYPGNDYNKHSFIGYYFGMDYPWDPNIVYPQTLIAVEISEGTTMIPNNAFQAIPNVTSIIIPSSITHIGNLAYVHNYSLLEIVIPENVTVIGSNNFMSQYVLDKITMMSVTPPTITSSTFSSLNANVNIYVPVGSLAAYQTAPNWSAIASRIYETPTS